MPKHSLLAQTDPEETVEPYPIATQIPVDDNSSYPNNVQAPTVVPANPSPYPIFTATPMSTVSSLPVVGNDPAPFITPIAPESTPSVSRSDLIQSNLILWAGFLIGLFILATGIYGAIILYTRK